MNNPFNDLYEFLEQYLTALEAGATKAIAATPLLIRQEFASQARRSLSTSLSEYMASLDIKLSDGVLIVEQEGSWLAEAVERGISGFEMKDTLLKSPKAKLSKKGTKYLHVPLPVSKTKPNASTDKAQLLQQKIREALNDPIFSNPKVSLTPEGSFKKMEQLVTADPQLKGMYKIQGFKDKNALQNNNPSYTQYLMFRTISNNPFAKSKWQHPGIEPKRLFPKVNYWADNMLKDIIGDIITDHMTDFLSGKGK